AIGSQPGGEAQDASGPGPDGPGPRRRASRVPPVTTPSSAAPRMSVIVMVDRRRARGARALRSLLAPSDAGALEILLLDFGWREYPPLPGSDHPGVSVLRLDRGITLGAARASGVLEARAPIVAFLEEHATALPGWTDALLSAHAAPVAAVA